MPRDAILILEDNAERRAYFTSAVASLPGISLVVWPDAPSMIRELPDWLGRARLVSLDHDLNPQHPDSPDPLTGFEAAAFLATQTPCCPVILHTTNYLRVESMDRELRDGGWQTFQIRPFRDDWIERFWLPKVRELIAQ